jgi:undecaprenyl-diphosphatase
VQILAAVFPGTSRSMATIAAGQVAGMSRSAALDFSFLVSLPVMFAACGYSFVRSIREMRTNPQFLPADLDANPWVILAIGFVVSFIVALVVNRWFIGWVKKRGFAPFAIYRIILGIIVLALASRIPAH